MHEQAYTYGNFCCTAGCAPADTSYCVRKSQTHVSMPIMRALQVCEQGMALRLPASCRTRMTMRKQGRPLRAAGSRDAACQPAEHQQGASWVASAQPPVLGSRRPSLQPLTPRSRPLRLAFPSCRRRPSCSSQLACTVHIPLQWLWPVHLAGLARALNASHQQGSAIPVCDVRVAAACRQLTSQPGLCVQ